MIINKKNRSINKAKKKFVKWAKWKKASIGRPYISSDKYWEYYRENHFFIDSDYVSASFKKHPSNPPSIDVVFNTKHYYDLTIKEFKELLKTM